jgi:hypothetical protein
MLAYLALLLIIAALPAGWWFGHSKLGPWVESHPKLGPWAVAHFRRKP